MSRTPAEMRAELLVALARKVEKVRDTFEYGQAADDLDCAGSALATRSAADVLALLEEWERWRKEGRDELERALWAIIDRDGLGDVPSDIVAAVSRISRAASAGGTRTAEQWHARAAAAERERDKAVARAASATDEALERAARWHDREAKYAIRHIHDLTAEIHKCSAAAIRAMKCAPPRWSASTTSLSEGDAG